MEMIVSDKTGKVIVDVLHDTWAQEILALEHAPEDAAEKDLDAEEIKQLTERMGALPEIALDAFFARYCFQLDDETIKTMYPISYPSGLIRYYTRVLSDSFAMERDFRISEASIRAAAETVLDAHVGALEKEFAENERAKRAQNRRKTIRRILRTAAVAAAVLVVAFMVPFSASASFRARMVSWFRQTFTEYSIFRPQSAEDITIDVLRTYRPTYVPDGYWLMEIVETDGIVSHNYANEHDDMLHIVFQIPGRVMYLDTENMTETRLMFNGEECFYYSGEDGDGSLVLSIDGIAVYVSGRIPQSEMIEIVKNIQKE